METSVHRGLGVGAKKIIAVIIALSDRYSCTTEGKKKRICKLRAPSFLRLCARKEDVAIKRSHINTSENGMPTR